MIALSARDRQDTNTNIKPGDGSNGNLQLSNRSTGVTVCTQVSLYRRHRDTTYLSSENNYHSALPISSKAIKDSAQSLLYVCLVNRELNSKLRAPISLKEEMINHLLA